MVAQAKPHSIHAWKRPSTQTPQKGGDERKPGQRPLWSPLPFYASNRIPAFDVRRAIADPSPGCNDRAMTNARTISRIANPAPSRWICVSTPRSTASAGGVTAPARRSGPSPSQTTYARIRAPLAADLQLFRTAKEPPPLRAQEQKQCQTAKCSSMPPTRRKLGSWSNATAG